MSGIIINPSDVDPFVNRNCTVLIGALALVESSVDVDEELLLVFENVTTIMGPLTLHDNSHIASLAFLNNLRDAESIFIRDNMALMDARLPSLFDDVRNGAKVFGNQRLCAAYSVQRPGPFDDNTDTNCPTLDVLAVINTNCPTLPSAVSILASLLDLPPYQVRYTFSYGL